MSMLLMVKAMQSKAGNPLRKLVLIKLADNANDKGECWPSYQHIADQCEIARSTVRKHIKDLSDFGYLSIEHRAGEKGNSSNLYRLTIDKGVPKATLCRQKAQGVPSDDTTPMPSDSTRTSNSLEPVIEPFIDQRSIDVDSAFNHFWLSMFLTKKAPPTALKAFKKAVKKIDDPMHFAAHLVNDTKTRFDNKQFGFDKMHPTTYLNQARWEDDYTVDKSPESNKAQMNSNDTSWIDLQDDML